MHLPRVTAEGEVIVHSPTHVQIGAGLDTRYDVLLTPDGASIFGPVRIGSDCLAYRDRIIIQDAWKAISRVLAHSHGNTVTLGYDMLAQLVATRAIGFEQFDDRFIRTVALNSGNSCWEMVMTEPGTKIEVFIRFHSRWTGHFYSGPAND